MTSGSPNTTCSAVASSGRLGRAASRSVVKSHTDTPLIVHNLAARHLGETRSDERARREPPSVTPRRQRASRSARSAKGALRVRSIARTLATVAGVVAVVDDDLAGLDVHGVDVEVPGYELPWPASMAAPHPAKMNLPASGTRHSPKTTMTTPAASTPRASKDAPGACGCRTARHRRLAGEAAAGARTRSAWSLSRKGRRGDRSRGG